MKRSTPRCVLCVDVPIHSLDSIDSIWISSSAFFFFFSLSGYTVGQVAGSSSSSSSCVFHAVVDW